MWGRTGVRETEALPMRPASTALGKDFAPAHVRTACGAQARAAHEAPRPAASLRAVTGMKKYTRFLLCRPPAGRFL